MKFLITESCAYNGGTHAEAGEVITVSANEAQELAISNRGHVVPDDYGTPEPEAKPKKK